MEDDEEELEFELDLVCYNEFSLSQYLKDLDLKYQRNT
jgi:hypothetical protein